MEILIDIDDSVPLFAQLIGQIKEGVLGGRLNPGDGLPSIRQLASDLQINAKTVAKAYQLLERDSVIETKGYRGTFIHPDARANSTVDLKGWTIRRMDENVQELRGAGVTDSEIRKAFAEAMNRPGR